MAALLQFSIAACCYRLYRSLGVLYIVLYCIILHYIVLYCIILYYIVSLVSCEIIIWVPDLKSSNGQYNVHGRALTQVVTAVLAESFGQKC